MNSLWTLFSLLFTSFSFFDENALIITMFLLNLKQQHVRNTWKSPCLQDELHTPPTNFKNVCSNQILSLKNVDTFFFLFYTGPLLSSWLITKKAHWTWKQRKLGHGYQEKFDHKWPLRNHSVFEASSDTGCSIPIFILETEFVHLESFCIISK